MWVGVGKSVQMGWKMLPLCSHNAHNQQQVSLKYQVTIHVDQKIINNKNLFMEQTFKI